MRIIYMRYFILLDINSILLEVLKFIIWAEK